jgi:hypothetical protein
MKGTVHTFSSRPKFARSVTKILPALMGPTVCELLGPTYEVRSWMSAYIRADKST